MTQSSRKYGDSMLATKIRDRTGFGMSITDISGDDEVEVWTGTQSNNLLMVIKLGDKELRNVRADTIRKFISSLQRAVSANHKNK